MTHLYTRAGDRAPIHWEPDETDLGRQAVESAVGSIDTYPVDVDRQTAAQIRAEYQRLVDEQTSGGST